MKIDNQKRKVFSGIRNQKGILSVDFLFSMIIAAVMCIFLFSMATTYTVIEIAQYFAFSTARAQASAHKTDTDQRDRATAKFKNLMANKIISPLFKNGWFTLSLDKNGIRSGPLQNGDFSADYEKSLNAPIPQTGVRLILEAKLLNMKLGPLGSTVDENGVGYSTKVTGMLIREPTWEECWKQMDVKARYDSILNLDARYKAIADPVKTKYLAMEDNGC